MARHSIIIDTDPGQDDAVALLLAFAASDALEVVGVTTVAGNVPLDLTQANARKICELAGRADVPVFAGADAPLTGALVTAAEIHGEGGLDGVHLPPPAMPLQPAHAVDFLVDTIMAAEPGTLTLCTLGPLTNVALALRREPAIARRLKRIVSMGGGRVGGNVTPVAEFNIHTDAQAAAEVFASGAAMVLLPLDVTYKVLVTPEWVARMRALGTPVGQAVAGLTSWFDRYDSRKFGENRAPLHDACVIAWLLWPELFAGRQVNVRVETTGALTRGMTVVDWWSRTGQPANTLFLDTVDADTLFARMAERLGRL